MRSNFGASIRVTTDLDEYGPHRADVMIEVGDDDGAGVDVLLTPRKARKLARKLRRAAKAIEKARKAAER